MAITVLISCANDLIGQSVEKLCRTQKDLDVINASFLDQPDWVKLLARLQPDVFIVDEADYHLDLHTPTWPFELLEHFPDLRVIEVSEQANQLYIYQRRKVLVSQVADLFSAVRDLTDDY
jgi:hypothetical protein